MKLLISFLLLCSCSGFLGNKNKPVFLQSSRMASTELKSKPFAVIVEAEIQSDRMEEFLSLIQINAENTRKEPGCIRFGE